MGFFSHFVLIICTRTRVSEACCERARTDRAGLAPENRRFEGDGEKSERPVGGGAERGTWRLCDYVNAPTRRCVFYSRKFSTRCTSLSLSRASFSPSCVLSRAIFRDASLSPFSVRAASPLSPLGLESRLGIIYFFSKGRVWYARSRDVRIIVTLYCTSYLAKKTSRELMSYLFVRVMKSALSPETRNLLRTLNGLFRFPVNGATKLILLKFLQKERMQMPNKVGTYIVATSIHIYSRDSSIYSSYF